MISPTMTNQFLQRNTPKNVTKQRPLLWDLVFELSRGTQSSWPKKGQLTTVVLNVKYAFFHRIGITNWCPSSHRSSLSISLAMLIYQIGTKSPFNYGAFILNQIKHHVGSKALKLPICYPCLIFGILLS